MLKKVIALTNTIAGLFSLFLLSWAFAVDLDVEDTIQVILLGVGTVILFAGAYAWYQYSRVDVSLFWKRVAYVSLFPLIAIIVIFALDH